MKRVEVDVMTGETIEILLTAEEIAAIEAAEAERLASLPPPSVVSMGQARAALIQAGLIAQVDAALASIPGVEGDVARSDWEYRIEVRRDWPLVQALKAQMGWTDAQLDSLFTLAATL